MCLGPGRRFTYLFWTQAAACPTARVPPRHTRLQQKIERRAHAAAVEQPRRSAPESCERLRWGWGSRVQPNGAARSGISRNVLCAAGRLRGLTAAAAAAVARLPLPAAPPRPEHPMERPR